MSITALPQPPTRSDPVNFNPRADAFLSALPTFATEANELQADVNAKQTAAALSASNAAAAELAANAAANVTAWVSGTNYDVGNVRYSPITYLSYRRKTAGAGTTDPSADSTNWQLINGTGNVDLNSTQTLTNKEIGSGSTINGIPVANLVNTTGNQNISGNKTFTQPVVTQGSVPGSNFTAHTISNSGGGANTNVSIAAKLHGVNTGDIMFNDTGDGGCEIIFSRTPTGNANIDRRVFDVKINKNGQVEAQGFIPTGGAGAVGTYAILFSASSVTYDANYAGSSLRAQGAARASDNVLTTPNGTGNLQNGTWKCLGSFSSANGGLALFLRIS